MPFLPYSLYEATAPSGIGLNDPRQNFHPFSTHEMPDFISIKCAIHSSFSRCSSTIWSTLFARECFLSCLKNKNCVFFLSTLRITTDFQTTSESAAYSQRPAPFPLKNMRCHLLSSRKKTPQKILYYIFYVFLTHLLLRSPASKIRIASSIISSGASLNVGITKPYSPQGNPLKDYGMYRTVCTESIMFRWFSKIII